MPIKVDVVTAEGTVYSDSVDAIVAPGIEGELGILPHHAPLMTMLRPGELMLRKGTEEECISVSGGYLEVRPDHVIVLADAAERAEQIDVHRAEEAMRRAQLRLKEKGPAIDVFRAEAALRRAMARLHAAERAKRKRAISRQ